MVEVTSQPLDGTRPPLRLHGQGRPLHRTLALDNYRARSSAPTLQGFLTEDPTGLSGGDPSLYQYVKDSPRYGRDPLGLCVMGQFGSDCDNPIHSALQTVTHVTVVVTPPLSAADGNS